MLIAAIIILVATSFLYTYRVVGGAARVMDQPEIIRHHGKLLHVAWVVPFVVGTVLLFRVSWIYGTIAIFLFLFVSPLATGPTLKRIGFL